MNVSHKKFLRYIIFTIVLFNNFLHGSEVAQAAAPVVHAILFFSPSCGHCHKVINEDLPPLIDTYGDQLQILGVNVAVPEGQKLYQAAIEAYNIPEPTGVPMLIVGQSYLIGSLDIPNEFPQIIEEALKEDGIPWPNIPGLADVLPQIKSDNRQINDESSTNSETSPYNNDSGSIDSQIEDSGIENSVNNRITFREKFNHDPVGNSFSIVVLSMMVFSIAGVGYKLYRSKSSHLHRRNWFVPLLSFIGLVIAIYLSYVEITATEAVCGPVGDCNTVQQSEYAKILGVVPIGVLGTIGYVLIIGSWGFNMFGPSQLRNYAAIATWVFALLGTLFSIYLTFLEPFVIGATCAWCLTSAIIMTILLWLTSPPPLLTQTGS